MINIEMENKKDTNFKSNIKMYNKKFYSGRNLLKIIISKQKVSSANYKKCNNFFYTLSSRNIFVFI